MVAKKEIVPGCVRACRNWMIGLVFTIFCSIGAYAQQKGDVVKALVCAGFENVSQVMSGSEEIITFENSVWKADGEGISKAIDLIGKYPLLPGKVRRVVVLQQGVPQISFVLPASTPAGSGKPGWSLAYSLGDTWKTESFQLEGRSCLLPAIRVPKPKIS